MRLIIRWSPPAHQFRPYRVPQWLDRLRCALLGHDDEIVVGERVMALHCRRCKWRSSGWHLGPRVREPLSVRGDARAAPHLPIVLRPRTTTQ